MQGDKCAHPACTCIPKENEKFCSRLCEHLQREHRASVELLCHCGHPACGKAVLDI